MFTLGLVKQTNSLSPTTTIQPTNEEQSQLSDLKSDLENAETKDAQKSEIIKQIRRMNNDGSYTVGYEADDGTFKIESRDVLGNVKGTYGYVDSNGEIKRVSYTANNQTNGLKSTTPPPSEPDAEIVHIPRQNKTGFAASTTRRPPSLAYLTSSPASPTRASVVQPIPKRRILLASSERSPYSHQFSSTRQNEYTTVAPRNNKAERGEPTTTVVYATSVPSFKPHVNIRPTPLPNTYKTEQLSRPDKLEITDHVSKVQISSNRESSTTKPVFEATDEKVSERKSVRGNQLRRQLSDDHDEKFEAQQQVIYSQSAGDDSSHIYGGVTGTARPLFTTSSPRIPSLVLAARSRAAQLQNVINAQTTSTTEKVYAKPPRRRPEPENDDEQTTESTSENNYITQGPVSVQIPANRDIQEASEDDKRVYRRPVVAYQPSSRGPREFSRQSQPAPDFDYGGPRQFRLPIPQAYPPPPYPQGYQRPVYTETPRPEPEQYLRETSAMVNKGAAATPAQFPAIDPNDQYQPQRGNQYLPYQQQRPESGYEQPSIPVPFQNPYSPYRPPLPSQYYNNPDRPLTARDFERLLNLLVIRHQQIGRYNYNGIGGGFGAPINPYYNGYNPYGSSQFGYQQIPRPPLYNPYDPRYSGYNRQIGPPLYGQYSENENMYQQQQQPITAPDQQIPFAGQRSIPRRRPYGPQYFGAPDNYSLRPEYTEASQPQGEYLPGEVREELLYRMLLLAMHPNEAQGSETAEGSSPEYVASSSSTTTVSPNKYRKPVRSVQILGEE